TSSTGVEVPELRGAGMHHPGPLVRSAPRRRPLVRGRPHRPRRRRPALLLAPPPRPRPHLRPHPPPGRLLPLPPTDIARESLLSVTPTGRRLPHQWCRRPCRTRRPPPGIPCAAAPWRSWHRRARPPG